MTIEEIQKEADEIVLAVVQMSPVAQRSIIAKRLHRVLVRVVEDERKIVAMLLKNHGQRMLRTDAVMIGTDLLNLGQIVKDGDYHEIVRGMIENMGLAKESK